jgi:hypothetical protein
MKIDRLIEKALKHCGGRKIADVRVGWSIPVSYWMTGAADLPTPSRMKGIIMRLKLRRGFNRRGG